MKAKVSKKKYFLFKMLEIVLAILPLVGLVLVRHEKYIYSVGSAIELSAGAVIALVIIVGTFFKKLHLNGIAWSIMLLIMSWFLRALIDDLIVILLCLTIGLIASKIAGYFAEEESERVKMERGAIKTAEVLQSMQNSGRV